MPSDARIPDGQWDWSAGVDSGKLTTVKSERNPNGLERNKLAWLGNGTVRGGGIMPAAACKSLITSLAPLGLYQGGIIYRPEFANPYLICSIAGRIYQALLEDPFTVTDLSAVSGLTNPAAIDKAYFVQAEQFVVIQAGDYGLVPVPTLPLFWDGTALRRSIGITTTTPTPKPGENEIPAATCMDYFQGRIWYAQGRTFKAGDTVFNRNTGTAGYGYRDSVLNVTESPLCFEGDGFCVPSQAGNIRSLTHTTNMDATLGQGDLYAICLETAYKMSVPVNRQAWIDAGTVDAKQTSNSKTAPQLTVVQDMNGTYSDRSVVSANGDLFYRSINGFNSLMVSLRYFQQWGNRPISSNVNRILAFDNRALLRFVSGINFENRLWETVLPIQTAVGVAFQGITTLDFDIISSFGQNILPAWEGIQERLYVLQLFQGDFGGLFRAFAVVVSRIDGSLQVWEFTSQDRSDEADKQPPDGDRRIVWYCETPAYTWEKEFELKQLDGGEIWFDKVFGAVEVRVEYRPDFNPCWQFWAQETFCVARSSCEDVNNPVCYPEQPYREGYYAPMVLPKPPEPACAGMPQRRPMNQAYQFQVRITVKGWCRIRGIIVYAIPVAKAPFGGLNC